MLNIIGYFPSQWHTNHPFPQSYRELTVHRMTGLSEVSLFVSSLMKDESGPSR